MVHAWLVIRPVNEELDGVDTYGERRLALGIQRMFSAPSYGEIHNQMYVALQALGVNPSNLAVPHQNDEGELLGDATYPSGLEWAVYPCRSNGHNIDVDPIEPRAE